MAKRAPRLQFTEEERASPELEPAIQKADKKIKKLEQQVAMGFTEKFDDTHTVMRICTSWATRSEDVDALIALL